MSCRANNTYEKLACRWEQRRVRGKAPSSVSLQIIKTEGRNKHVWSACHDRAQDTGDSRGSEHPLPIQAFVWDEGVCLWDLPRADPQGPILSFPGFWDQKPCSLPRARKDKDSLEAGGGAQKKRKEGPRQG